jgi:Uma2 family endonuclease
MQVDALAPWAEPVPHGGLMSVDDLLALPDDGWHYELVEGRLVRMPPSGVPASRLAMRLGARLTTHVEDRNLGIVTGTDGGFTLSKGTTLATDVAFVRADRVLPPTSPDYDKPWPLAPDLVVEIASPNQSRPKMAAKARRYLRAGVRLVWVVWPKRREVDVWRPGDPQPSTTLRIADALEGLDVVPGFSYPLVELFK